MVGCVRETSFRGTLAHGGWRRPQFVLALTALAVLATLGCSNSDERTGLWGRCSTPAECQSGVCEWVYATWNSVTCPDGFACSRFRCTLDCSAASCPAGTACGTSADGQRVCMSSCATGGYEGYGACVSGAFESCPQLAGDERYCNYCGCAVSGEVCMNSYHAPTDPEPPYCDPPLPPGSPCGQDSDCTSSVCIYCGSASPPQCPAHVCSDPIGGPCTAASCEFCVSGTFCTENCYSHSHCPGGFTCVARYVDSAYFCWMICQPGDACPAGLTCGGIRGQWGGIVGYACM